MSKTETVVTLQHLPALAREARKSAHMTQIEAAERLGVAQSNISVAERDNSGRYHKLQLRMIEELAGWQVEGPLWRLHRTEDK